MEDSGTGYLLEAVLAFASLIALFWSVRRRIVGLEGVVTEEASPYAIINLDGEKWRAVAVDGAHLRAGERVVVLRVQGLQLAVVSRESSVGAPVQAG